MAALFPKSADDIARGITVGVALTIVGGLVLIMVLARTPYCTQQQWTPIQPVNFDHRHHVRDDGIDCLYCHGDAMKGRFAGVPPTSVCMGCHAQIWSNSKELAPLHQSIDNDVPIHWRRVTALPDFVFFDHHAHTRNGVGCVTCHGRVDSMPLVSKAASMTMGWCIDCHRNPAQFLRPLDRITDMAWKNEDPFIGQKIADQLHIKPPLNCSGCHR